MFMLFIKKQTIRIFLILLIASILIKWTLLKLIIASIKKNQNHLNTEQIYIQKIMQKTQLKNIFQVSKKIIPKLISNWMYTCAELPKINQIEWIIINLMSRVNKSRRNSKKRIISHATKSIKRNFSSNTKNLVLQAKKLFKRVAFSIKNFPPQLLQKLIKSTNISVLRQCLEVSEFREQMIRLHQSEHLLKMLIQGRMEHRNLANFLIYYNRLVNGVYNPAIMMQGFWTVDTSCFVKEQEVNYPYDNTNQYSPFILPILYENFLRSLWWQSIQNNNNPYCNKLTNATNEVKIQEGCQLQPQSPI